MDKKKSFRRKLQLLSHFLTALLNHGYKTKNIYFKIFVTLKRHDF